MTEREKLEVQVTTQGADRAARELSNVNKEADKLDNKKIEIGGLDLGSDVDLLSNKLSGLAGPGGIIAGLGAGMAFVANSTADAAIEADNLASLTGDSVEQASRLNAVWKQTGADSKDLQDVLLQMNGVLATNAGLAEELGVNLSDGATVGERFEQVSDALDGITDAAKRSQIASQVFGEEGVRQYNALRQAVGDVGTAMEGVAAGQVFDEQDVEDAREMKRQLNEIKAELTGLANQIGKVAIPAFSGLIDGIKDVGKNLFDSGRALRTFIETGEITTAAQEFNAAFEESENIARDFDRTLLDGLDTFAQVRAAVLEQIDNVHAANLVALEWKSTQEQLPPVIDAVTEALNVGDTAWQKYIEDNERGLAIADGAPGTFAEMAAAADAAVPSIEELAEAAEEKAARGFEILAGAVNAVKEAMDAAFDDLDDDLDQLERLSDIEEQFTRIAEAETMKEAQTEIRRLIGLVADYAQNLDDLPPEKVSEIIARLRTGDVEEIRRVLDELTQDQFINVGINAPQPGFQSGNVAFNPAAGTISPTFQGVQSAVPSGPMTVINNYPVGTTPTTQYQNDLTDTRRNGIR